MITINLAFDEDIASELTSFLTKLGIDSKQEKSEVQVNKTNLDEKILNS